MPVRFREREANLIQKISDNRQRNLWIRLLEIGEGLAIQKLHHQVRHVAARGSRDAEIGDIDDVRMAQTPAGLRLTLESRQKLRLCAPTSAQSP